MLAHLWEIRATILHLSAWSGVSASILVGLGFLAFMLPEWRAIALRGGIVVAIAYATLIYGSQVGRTEIRAQWDAANVRAAAEKETREAALKTSIEAKYAPAIAALQQQSGELTVQGHSYEKWILSGIAAGSNPCAVGPRALELRRKAR